MVSVNRNVMDADHKLIGNAEALGCSYFRLAVVTQLWI